MKEIKFCVCVAIGILLGLFLKLFVFDILHISGNSMSPALKDGDTVIVNKLAYGLNVPFKGKFFFQWNSPKRGDAVIYFHDNKIVVKRCVATENTHLDFSTDSGYILNIGTLSVKLTKNQYEKLKNFSEIPKGYIFALGDNQEQSLDSRDYGFVSIKNITGKIIGK